MQRPFAYLQQIAGYFKSHEKLWQSFSAAAVRQAGYDQFRTQLLKDTYRLDRAAQPGVYAAVDKAKAILDIPQEITVYQLMQPAALNAFVYPVGQEAHIVLSGDILKLMQETELLSVLAHELGHIRLLTEDDGDYLVTARILNALTTGADATAAYMETARLYDLYIELYCDQMSLLVTGDPLPVIASLVKVSTGLESVSAESYIRQATEIFEAEEVKSESITHPESFIRAYALHLAHTAPDSFMQKILPVIQGKMRLQALDVLSAEKLQEYSRQLILAFLNDKAVQTETTLNLAGQYFPGFRTDENNAMPRAAFIAQCDAGTREYLACLLFDFAQADEDIEREAFSRAFTIAAGLELKDTLKELIKKELKLSEKKFTDRYKKTLAVYA